MVCLGLTAATVATTSAQASGTTTTPTLPTCTASSNYYSQTDPCVEPPGVNPPPLPNYASVNGTPVSVVLSGPQVLEPGKCPADFGAATTFTPGWCTSTFTLTLSAPTLSAAIYKEGVALTVTPELPKGECSGCILEGLAPGSGNNALNVPATWCSHEGSAGCSTYTVSQPLRLWGWGGPVTALVCVDVVNSVVANENSAQPQQGERDGTSCLQIAFSNGPVAASASLGVALSAPSSPTFEVGATIPVTATISAQGGAVGSISLGSGLGASTSGVRIASAGALPASFSLVSGASRTFQFLVTVTKVAKVRLILAATGRSASGSISGSATLTLGAQTPSPLKISIQFLQHGEPISLAVKGGESLPNTIRLADADKAEVPQDVTAAITLKNVSSSTLENVSLNGPPAFSYANPAQATQTLPLGVVGSPTPGDEIGTLAPGKSARVDYVIRVTNNGSFVVSVQALMSEADSSATEVANGSGTLTALPTALLWLSLEPSTTALVTAGSSILISGRVTNRSMTQTIEVAPIFPDVSGNAGSGALVDLESDPNPDGTITPFSGKLAPGQSVDLVRVVGTAPFPSTRATLTFDPQGWLLNSDGTKTKLAGSQIGMSSGTSPILIHISTADPAVSTDPRAIVDGFTAGAIDAADELFIEGLRSTAELLQHPIDSGAAMLKGVVGIAVATNEAAAQAAYLVVSLHLFAVAYLALTPTQRAEWENQLESDMLNSNLGLAGDAVNRAVSGYLTNLSTAISTNNYPEVAQIISHDTTKGVGTVGELVLGDLLFQKLAIGFKAVGSALAASATGRAVAGSAAGDLLNAVSLESSIKKYAVTPVLGKEIEGIPAGTNLLANGAIALIQQFGLTPRQITELVNYCERSNIIVAVRSRSERAAELIAKGLAVGKNEVIKLKNVNFYDVQYLGYSRQDLNTVVWAKPLTKAEVEANLAGADEATVKIVMDRWKLRVKEWNDPSIKSLINTSEVTGRINWGFNGADNGVPLANRADERLFGLKAQANPSKYGGKSRPYFQVMVGSKPSLGGRLVQVTQDVDLMAVLGANGSILSPAQRLDAYIHLLDVLGIEHPETPSYIKNGEIMFQAKAKYLADVVKGGEQVAVFSPQGGVTAGYFDPALTVFDQSTMGGRVFFDGGYNDPVAKTVTKVQLSLANMANLP